MNKMFGFGCESALRDNFAHESFFGKFFYSDFDAFVEFISPVDMVFFAGFVVDVEFDPFKASHFAVDNFS